MALPFWLRDRRVLGLVIATALDWGNVASARVPRAMSPAAPNDTSFDDAFGVLAFRPDMKDHLVYRASVATLFAAASSGFTGLAAVAWKRWLEER